MLHRGRGKIKIPKWIQHTSNRCNHTDEPQAFWIRYSGQHHQESNAGNETRG